MDSTKLPGEEGDLFRDVLSRFTEQRTAVTGESGGGAVRVKIDATSRVESVSIAPEALQDPAMLEDLVAAAMNDALERARAANQEVALGLLDQLGRS